MQSFEINDLIKNIHDKTLKNIIKWSPYNAAYDNNPFSRKYFSSVLEFSDTGGYIAKFRQGFLFLIPSFSEVCCLCLQPTAKSIPTIINYEFNQIIKYELLQELYEYIHAPAKELREFIDEINS